METQVDYDKTKHGAKLWSHALDNAQKNVKDTFSKQAFKFHLNMLLVEMRETGLISNSDAMLFGIQFNDFFDTCTEAKFIAMKGLNK